MRPAARDIDASRCATHSNLGQPRLGSADVRINGAGALVTGDQGFYHAPCTGSDPWRAAEGAATVLVNGLELVTLNDATSHPHSAGTIVAGSTTVMVGGPTITVFERARADALSQLDAMEASLLRWNEEDRAHFREWFGDDSEEARQAMLEKTRNMRERIEEVTMVHAEGDAFAHVHPAASSTMYMEDEFWASGRSPPESQGSTVIHEASHYWGTPGTDDHAYGPTKCKRLAEEHPDKAQDNADNIAYYAEGVPR